jgi:hypothetical protein
MAGLHGRAGRLTPQNGDLRHGQFLLGPIQDILIQRPLLCSSLVCCDKPCVRPALNQNPECCGKTMRWEEEDLEGGGRRYQTPRDRLAAGGARGPLF